MKIAYVSNALIPSRSANSIHVMRMCQAFAKEGHDISLIAPAYPKRYYDQDVKDLFKYYDVSKIFGLFKLSCPYSSHFVTYLISTLIYSRKIGTLLKSLQPDLVYGRYLPGCCLAAQKGYHTIYEAHGLVWESTLEGILFKKFITYNSFCFVTVISDALKKRYLTYTNLSDEQLIVAHDGADQLDLDKKTAQWPGRKSKPQVGYFGSLYAGRGIEIILNVASRLPDVDFHIVGGSREDVARLRPQASAKNILFHGYVSPGEIHTYRNCCDILLAPYGNKVAVFGNSGNTSSFMSPLKIFEYMATKKAMVVSDLPVLREVLHENNALFVPPDNIEKWQEAIEELVHDTAKREKLAARAYEDFKQNYTWRKRAEHLINAASKKGAD